MKTMTGLIPLAIGVAAAGVVTWYALTRDWAIGPWLLAALLFAHGWVHLMFVFPQPDPAAATAGAAAWPFDMAGSWLISAGGVDLGLVRGLGITLMAVVCVGFALAALSTVGLLVPAGWWAGLVVGSATGSLVLLTMFFSPLLLLGYAIDLALVGLVLASVWSPTATAIP
jgi:hypothetical protein